MQKYKYITDIQVPLICIFYYCVNIVNQSTSFNGDISGWDVTGVTNMDFMFSGATSFNNGGEPLDWQGSLTASMVGVFYNATAFDQYLRGWCVSTLSDPSSFANNSAMSTKPDFQPK